MSWLDYALIAGIIIWVMVPPAYDPAIRWKERNERRRGRRSAISDACAIGAHCAPLTPSEEDQDADQEAPQDGCVLKSRNIDFRLIREVQAGKSTVDLQGNHALVNDVVWQQIGPLCLLSCSEFVEPFGHRFTGHNVFGFKAQAGQDSVETVAPDFFVEYGPSKGIQIDRCKNRHLQEFLN